MLKNNSNIMVTGGAGFIGSSFIRNILSAPFFKGSVINVDILTYAANVENLQSVEKDPRYVFIQEDVNHQENIEKICRHYDIDLIVHFAAQTHVDRSITDPLCFIDTNIKGTFHLLEVVRKNPKIHFHQISTDEVFGALTQTGVFKEQDPYLPNSPYSASKAAADHFVRAYHKTYKIKATISHSCNNYGPSQYPEKFIPLIITSCIDKKPIPIYGDGSNIREWMYVDDHAKALIHLLQKIEHFDVYNIGSNIEITNFSLVQLILNAYASITGDSKEELESLIEFVPDRAGHDFRYALDISKLKTLGFKGGVSLKEGILSTIKWYLAQTISHPF